MEGRGIAESIPDSSPWVIVREMGSRVRKPKESILWLKNTIFDQ